jgi:hypothetical protein
MNRRNFIASEPENLPDADYGGAAAKFQKGKRGRQLLF